MSISVTVAVGDVGDRLVEAIAARLPKVKVGNGADPDSEMGPLITAEHRDRVAGYIGAGESAGARVVVDGRAAELPADGYFLGTTLLDRVTPDMTVYTDEIFGPVLSVVRVETYDEAVALVNANRYANGTAIFTRDGGAARRYQFEVEVGMVGINVPIPVPLAYHTFGGWKRSAFGDLNQHGPDAVRFYTRTKTVTSRWPSGIKEGAQFSIPTMR
jgi:malonate-semialdehyde dehydrogenase (acetylating)/methylmalonate-semialdehyde dehydrogenase